ncbi:Uncharacterised protein [Pseudomonas aeruginosa]|nr:Uncharacterised protein [Pseudomonas aeruginosa]
MASALSSTAFGRLLPSTTASTPLLEVVGVEEQQGGVEAVDHQAGKSGGLRVLGQLDLAVDAVHPASTASLGR